MEDILLHKKDYGDPLLKSIYRKIDFIAKEFKKAEIAEIEWTIDLLDNTPVELVEYLFKYLKEKDLG